MDTESCECCGEGVQDWLPSPRATLVPDTHSVVPEVGRTNMSLRYFKLLKDALQYVKLYFIPSTKKQKM